MFFLYLASWIWMNASIWRSWPVLLSLVLQISLLKNLRYALMTWLVLKLVLANVSAGWELLVTPLPC